MSRVLYYEYVINKTNNLSMDCTRRWCVLLKALHSSWMECPPSASRIFVDTLPPSDKYSSVGFKIASVVSHSKSPDTTETDNCPIVASNSSSSRARSSCSSEWADKLLRVVLKIYMYCKCIYIYIYIYIHIRVQLLHIRITVCTMSMTTTSRSC